jgi:hypothetical protein
MTGDRARVVYELRVTDASAADRHEALLKSLLASLLDHSMYAFPEKVEVLIVDRRTDEIVWSRRTGSDVARLFAVDIDKDLDRLDPAAFATEWGIATNA